MAGYTALAVPLLAVRAGLADFSPFDYSMIATVTLIVSLAPLPAGQVAERRLAPESARG